MTHQPVRQTFIADADWRNCWLQVVYENNVILYPWFILNLIKCFSSFFFSLFSQALGFYTVILLFFSSANPPVRLAYFVFGGRGKAEKNCWCIVLVRIYKFKTTRGTATTSLDAMAPKIAKFIILITRRFNFVEVHLIIYAFNSSLPAVKKSLRFHKVWKNICFFEKAEKNFHHDWALS